MSKISESINSSEHIVFRNMEINTKSSKKKKKKERKKKGVLMAISEHGLGVRRIISCYKVCNLTLSLDYKHVLPC